MQPTNPGHSVVACWELLQPRGALPTQASGDSVLELELPGSSDQRGIAVWLWVSQGWRRWWPWQGGGQEHGGAVE